MTPKRKALLLAVVALVVFLVAGGYDAARREYHRYLDSRIGYWKHAVTATRDDIMATQTQVFDGGAHVSGTLGVYNQDDYPILISAPTKEIRVIAAGITCTLINEVNPGAPPGTTLSFAVRIIDNLGATVAEEWVDIAPGDTFDVERAFTYSVTGRQLSRTESTAPGTGRENSPVYAKEVTETDSWVVLDPVVYSVTFGSLSFIGSAASPPPPPVATILGAVSIYFDHHKGQNWTRYAGASNLTWDGGTIDFSRYEKESVAGVNPTAGGAGVYLDGLDGGIDLYSNSPGNWNNTVVHAQPYIVDFSSFGVWDRVGALKPNVRIDGGFTATNHVPASLDWSPTP